MTNFIFYDKKCHDGRLKEKKWRLNEHIYLKKTIV